MTSPSDVPGRSTTTRASSARGLASVALGTAAALVLGGCGGSPSSGVPSPAATTAASSAATSPASSAASSAARVIDPRTVPAPVSVSAPSIDLSSGPLLSLGVAADGKAEVPEDYDRVGWFTGGGRPGARGPTVLMGHVDSKTGPAAFYDLRDLRPGDEISVALADGSAARYAVSGTEHFPKDAFPTAAVFGATTADVLRLITCAGDFDRGARSYVDNLVVTASRLP